MTISRSNRISQIHSDIRGPLYVEALRMQAAGERVLKLNTRSEEHTSELQSQR